MYAWSAPIVAVSGITCRLSFTLMPLTFLSFWGGKWVAKFLQFLLTLLFNTAVVKTKVVL